MKKPRPLSNDKNEINILHRLLEITNKNLSKAHDTIHELEDKLTIETGNHIRAIKKLKDENQVCFELVYQFHHFRKCKVNSSKNKSETLKAYNDYKKYSETEIKVLRNINDRLKSYW